MNRSLFLFIIPFILLFSQNVLAYPQYSDIQTEYNNLTNSTFRTWNTSSINISWSDSNTSIDKVLLEHNFSGSFLNYTLNNYTGNIYNYTFNVTNWNTTICWKSYANSTTPHWNTTNQYCFTVYNTTIQPTPETMEYYNGSADTSKYLKYTCIDNYTLKGKGTYQNQLLEVEIDCANGCDSSLNICIPSESMIYLIAISGFIIVIIIVILLRKAKVL